MSYERAEVAPWRYRRRRRPRRAGTSGGPTTRWPAPACRRARTAASRTSRTGSAGTAATTRAVPRSPWRRRSNRSLPDGALRLAVDALGGDNAPGEIVRGALSAARRLPADEVLLVGPEAEVKPHLGPDVPANVSLRPSGAPIGMDEEPAA